MELTKSVITFNVNEKKIKFSITHNLPKPFGLNIECALNSWLLRTKSFTAKSLCKYILSKDINNIAVPIFKLKK